jgi:hypothetical protein
MAKMNDEDGQAWLRNEIEIFMSHIARDPEIERGDCEAMLHCLLGWISHAAGLKGGEIEDLMTRAQDRYRKEQLLRRRRDQLQ